MYFYTQLGGTLIRKTHQLFIEDEMSFTTRSKPIKDIHLSKARADTLFIIIILSIK